MKGSDHTTHRTKSIYTRVTPQEKQHIQVRARQCGISVSEYLRQRALGSHSGIGAAETSLLQSSPPGETAGGNGGVSWQDRRSHAGAHHSAKIPADSNPNQGKDKSHVRTFGNGASDGTERYKPRKGQITIKEIVNIPIARLHTFEGHPFKVLDDGEMNELIESIQERGILTPLIIRPKEGTADEYEVVSGHRRLHAAIKAGLETVPALIRAMDRNSAAILVVESNLHREHILPSEKAFAYKLKMEAMKHQGKRTDLTSSQVATKFDAAAQIGASNHESRDQVFRYIRLTHLIPALLDLMDEGKIAFSVGVELSYLDQPAQEYLAELIQRDEHTPSYSQAVRMHKCCMGLATISEETIEAIMAEEKPNQREQIKFRWEELKRYFPEHCSEWQIRRDILAGLELLRRQRERNRDRDAR